MAEGGSGSCHESAGIRPHRVARVGGRRARSRMRSVRRSGREKHHPPVLGLSYRSRSSPDILPKHVSSHQLAQPTTVVRTRCAQALKARGRVCTRVHARPRRGFSPSQAVTAARLRVHGNVSDRRRCRSGAVARAVCNGASSGCRAHELGPVLHSWQAGRVGELDEAAATTPSAASSETDASGAFPTTQGKRPDGSPRSRNFFGIQ